MSRDSQPPRLLPASDGTIWSSRGPSRSGSSSGGSSAGLEQEKRRLQVADLCGGRDRRFARPSPGSFSEAFIGPRPAGMEACHESGDARDNRPDNLRWDTHAANMEDRRRHGTLAIGERVGSSKAQSPSRATGAGLPPAGWSYRVIAANFGGSSYPIHLIATGRAGHDSSMSGLTPRPPPPRPPLPVPAESLRRRRRSRDGANEAAQGGHRRARWIWWRIGQVGGDRYVGDLAVVGEPDHPGVDLGSPGDVPAFRLGWVGDGGEPGDAGGLADEISEHPGGERRVGRDGSFGVGGIDAVEAEDRVEVNQPAALELGDLGVGELDPDAVLAGELGEAAADGDDGAAPQFGGVSVPDDSSLVVVAVGADPSEAQKEER